MSKSGKGGHGRHLTINGKFVNETLSNIFTHSGHGIFFLPPEKIENVSKIDFFSKEDEEANSEIQFKRIIKLQYIFSFCTIPKCVFHFQRSLSSLFLLGRVVPDRLSAKIIFGHTLSCCSSSGAVIHL